MRKPHLQLLAVLIGAAGLAQAATTVSTPTPSKSTNTEATTSGVTTTTSSADKPTATTAAPAAGGTAATSTTTGASGAANAGGSSVIGTDNSRIAPATNTTESGTSDLASSNQTSGSVASGQTTTTRRPLDNALLGSELPATGTPTISGTGDTIIGPNGERIIVNNMTSVQPAPAVTPTPTLDAATKAAAARDRAKVARKGQLMHSIAPRTNNDRTDQMPDDPPSPALTLPAESPRVR